MIKDVVNELNKNKEETEKSSSTTKGICPVYNTDINSSKNYRQKQQQQQQTEKDHDNDDQLSIPSVLRHITKSQYIELKSNHLPTTFIPMKKEDVDVIMMDLSSLIIESVLIGETTWCLVTQFELYLRDLNAIDDYAIEQDYPYPDTPVALVHTKSEKGRIWKELSIYWGRYELLITGGLYGTKNGIDGINAFLGPSLPKTSPTFDLGNMTIMKSIISSKIKQRERRLRNYGKMAVNYL